MSPMDDAEPIDSKSPPLPQAELDILTDKLIEKLKSVFDPEIPVDIYELGLTLTAPGCPVAGEMPGWVEDAVRQIPEIRSCKVDLVFDPPWDPSRMTDEAKLQLNMF